MDDRALWVGFMVLILVAHHGIHATIALNVRLEGGNNPYEGRVEVYDGTQWGSVCDDKWTHINCMVVCAQIGLSGGTKLEDSYQYGTCTGPILLDDVHCVGDETNLGECDMSNLGHHNCEHKEDVGCRCQPNPNPPGTCQSRHHRIELVDGDVPWVGRAEVYDGTNWGAICDDHWDDLDAHVFCSCLGVYNETDKYRSYWSPALSALPPVPIAYDAVRCTAEDGRTRRNIWECQHTLAGGACGGPGEAAGVACGPLPRAVLPETPTVTLSCANGFLTACFTSDTYAMNADYLSMNEQCAEAIARNISNGVCYDIDLQKCRPPLPTSDHSEKHFCYDLSYSQFDSDPTTLLTDTVWSRRACCSQTKNGTAATSFRPLLIPVEDPSYTSSPVNFTLDCYEDESFSGAPISPATTLSRGQDVFCKVTSGIWDAGMYLVVPTCRFYGSPAASPVFTFLSNKCPTTDVLGLYFYNFEDHSWGFKFAVPKFQTYDDLYISCDAYVCDPSLDPKPYCDRSCSATSRRRRDLAETSRDPRSGVGRAVTKGPYKVNDTGFGPLLEINTQARIINGPYSEKTTKIMTEYIDHRPSEINRTPKLMSTKVKVRQQLEGIDEKPHPVSRDSSGSGTTWRVSLSLMVFFVMLVLIT